MPMIQGQVTGSRQAVFTLTVLGDGGAAVEVTPVLDTGFTEYLTLPKWLVDALALPFTLTTWLMFADGRKRLVNVYDAVVHWQGRERTIRVHELDAALLAGMSLLYGCHVGIDVIDGGKVLMEPLP